MDENKIYQLKQKLTKYNLIYVDIPTRAELETIWNLWYNGIMSEKNLTVYGANYLGLYYEKIEKN